MTDTVRSMMTKKVETLSDKATVYEAAVLMDKLNVGSVPILHGDELVGVVTDRDIVVRALAKGHDSHTKITEIMSQDVTVAEPDWSLKKAGEVMAKKQIRRLPVVEDGKLVGILSLGDVAVEGGKDTVSGEVLTGISQPTKEQ